MLNAVIITTLVFLLSMTLLGLQIETRKAARLGRRRDG